MALEPIARPQTSRMVAIAIVATASLSCSDASGCDGFAAESEPIAAGESATVELEVENGRYADNDIAGARWDTNDVPTPPIANGTILATATPMDGYLSLDFGTDGYRDVRFFGPLACD